MTTIYDVATRAGVSSATVSRVFNGHRVSPDKERRVLTAARELSYVPSRAARTLRRNSSEVIALLIPDIENPFFTSLARGVEDLAQESGYSVVLCNTDDDAAKETRYFDIANAENMAGVILAPSPEHGELARLVDAGRPVVAVDRTTEVDVDAVMTDNRAAGVAVTGALFEHGYRRIACIAGPQEVVTSEDRQLAWREVVRQRTGSEPEAALLQHGNYRVDGGRSAMAALLALDVQPDAVVTTNNLMGVGALQVLHEAGLTPPEVGVGVIGELPFPTISPDVVTQLHLPARHLGRTAATMLIDRINGDTQPTRTVVLRGELHAADTRSPRPS
jgi:LacI family transcriptional regulator